MTGEAGGRPIERWISLGTTIVAPVTALSALLFYFGYASTRAMYQYFGVDVDTVGLGSQDYLMRSPRPLLVPLVGLLLLGVFGLWLHVGVSDLLANPRGGRARTRMAARSAVAAGGIILLSSVLLVVLYPVPAIRDWPAYDLVVPLCLALGIVVLAYGRHVVARSNPSDVRDPPDPNDGREPPRRSLRRVATVLVVSVVAASIFWATSTLAQWSGRGQAEVLADRLEELPSVILDTKERLYVNNPDIQEFELPEEDGQTFRYRYRQLRLLLVKGGERMFLVPAKWSPSATTLLVPLSDDVRVQFQFENPGHSDEVGR
jgi:hypothetical protein